ncbi:hypothetical protein L3V83_06930 [Thiotrichales bacterium 19X7-9]|nr:hypothetical protein [Thiotrichales bacterium 19X7-9]
MHKLKFTVFTVLAISLYYSNNAFAVMPPEYLSVDGFQSCLSTKNMGTWQSYCIPETKPENCSQSSWDKLTTMNIPSCS